MDGEGPILHVLVVGFHHKKGCQVEFSYPPLILGNTVDSHELPEEWKHIPSLALPDGAHNFTKDTVYFVLPGRRNNLKTVYGVSCYRQMNANDLINKTADVTRSTVQKSVCVLSHLPLFGLIKAKLELITHAYFDERDFSQVSLLEETYNNLNSSLTQSLLESSQVFLDLPARELVALYKHKVIVLFKLLLLERRVLFFGTPVESLCQSVLGIVSLFPGMIEHGLVQTCNQGNNKKLSPTLGVTNFNSDLDEEDEFLEIRYHTSTQETPLSEVLNHIHNSDLNLQASGDTAHSRNVVVSQPSATQSEPPESPSIPRDLEHIWSRGENGEHQSLGLMTGGELSKPSSVAVEENLLSRKDIFHSQNSKPKSKLIGDSDKLTVHASSRSGKHFCFDSDSESLGNTNSSCNSSHPPHDNISAVQHADPSCWEMTNLDNTSKKRAGHQQSAGLSLLTTVAKPESEEWIDDLDSPESLSIIDKEDCFSWEQDHLQLSIDAGPVLDVAGDMGLQPLGSPARVDNDVITAGGEESPASIIPAVQSVQLESNKNGTQLVGGVLEESEPAFFSAKEKRPTAFKNKLSAALGKTSSKAKTEDAKAHEVPQLKEDLVSVQQDQFGHPLVIFTKGSICHPYLSLQYHDLLTDINTRSFVIGATNILFKQKRHLIDVIVEVGDGKLDIRDKELQRHLNLTTADFRFADYLVKTVTEEKLGMLDGTEWEGSDEWVRGQFRHYLNSLLSTVQSDDAKQLEDFGSAFVAAWKTTHNFRYWQEREHPAVTDNLSGHPFQGNLSMTDIRMRFSHTMQSTERGRKINAAVVQTGKYVVQTGRAVGGAFSSATSAVSGWFSSWRHNQKTSEEVKLSPDAEIISNQTASQ